jgi:tetratricopeptide (TPR) repeat protein
MEFRFKKIRVIIVFTVLSFSVLAKAQVRDQVFLGTRPLSMGEAFLAIADDGNAIYWNPAGLARMERIQTSFSYADLFGMGLNSYYLSFLSRLYFIPPLTDYLTFGMDWSAITLAEDDELEFSRNELHFAIGVRPSFISRYLKDLSLGLSATYLSMFGQAYNISETEVDARGWGANFGLLYHFDSLKILPGKLNVGFMIHDIGGTRIKHLNTEKKEKILNQNIRWGLSYRPFEQFPGGEIPISDPVFAIDIDDRLHFGLEFWVGHTFAFRAGIQKDLHTDEKMTLSFGLGIKTNLKDLPGLNVDYALTDSPVLPNTNKQFGGSLIFKENPRLIRIEKAHINNVFASLYLHYGKPGASIGSIKLKNFHNDTLKAWISFEENFYMESQQADSVIIPPETTIDFPIRAVFKPEIIKAPKGRLTNIVKATYTYKNIEHTTSAAIDFELYGLNYLTWDDPGKAAAFVTFDDPVVQDFVDEALEEKQSPDDAQWFFRFNISDALTIFNALQAYGFKYRRDPVTPADTACGGRYRPDIIQYPAQLLCREERAGDCDDLSVLYSSLLQNAGFATALVSIPGHIFLMFDTYIPASHCLSIPISPNRFVKRKGSLWIPIEATKIPTSNFLDAWRIGSETYYEALQEGTLDTFEVAFSQVKYPSVAYELLPYCKELKETIPAFVQLAKQDVAALEELKQQYYQTFEDSLNDKLATQEKVDIRNRYGIILGQNGDFTTARAQFQRILADSNFAPAWNNLGNIEFISGNYEKAELMYQKTLENNEYSRGTYLNLAMLYQMMTDSTVKNSSYQKKSEEMLFKAAQLLEGDTKSAFVILGVEEELAIGKAKSLIDKIKQRVKKTDIVLDRYGTKGWGEIDEDWGELLYWSY